MIDYISTGIISDVVKIINKCNQKLDCTLYINNKPAHIEVSQSSPFQIINHLYTLHVGWISQMKKPTCTIEVLRKMLNPLQTNITEIVIFSKHICDNIEILFEKMYYRVYKFKLDIFITTTNTNNINNILQYKLNN